MVDAQIEKLTEMEEGQDKEKMKANLAQASADLTKMAEDLEVSSIGGGVNDIPEGPPAETFEMRGMSRFEEWVDSLNLPCANKEVGVLRKQLKATKAEIKGLKSDIQGNYQERIKEQKVIIEGQEVEIAEHKAELDRQKDEIDSRNEDIEMQNIEMDKHVLEIKMQKEELDALQDLISQHKDPNPNPNSNPNSPGPDLTA